MNPCIEKLNAYFAENPLRLSREDSASILELLRYIYVYDTPVDNATIRYRFMQMGQIIEKLAWTEKDALYRLACDLCTEHMEEGFLAGVQVGFRLNTELCTSDT